MRSGFKWFIVIMLLTMLVLLFGVPLFGLVFGPGFDPS
jgi:hypothetical protein